MKKVKTADLTGTALDWAVAKCEGKDMKAWRTYKRLGLVNSSTDWAQGGPIIEREDICIVRWSPTQWAAKVVPGEYSGPPKHHQYGPTLLIAAMRCYVASKMGDEVEVPDELMK